MGPKSVGFSMKVLVTGAAGFIGYSLAVRLLARGDSGGPAWLRSGDGWAIAGINGNGTGDTTYGDRSEFARVSGLRDWILRVMPGARFVGQMG